MKPTNEFLQQHVFNGLKNLNTGFDVPSIYYFSAADFEIVLNRVNALGIDIGAIEPWKNGRFYDVLARYNFDVNDPHWYFKAFEKLKQRDSDLQYAATYDVPDGFLKNEMKTELYEEME